MGADVDIVDKVLAAAAEDDVAMAADDVVAATEDEVITGGLLEEVTEERVVSKEVTKVELDDEVSIATEEVVEIPGVDELAMVEDGLGAGTVEELKDAIAGELESVLLMTTVDREEEDLADEAPNKLAGSTRKDPLDVVALEEGNVEGRGENQTRGGHKRA